jgi:hypothetical protein
LKDDTNYNYLLKIPEGQDAMSLMFAKQARRKWHTHKALMEDKFVEEAPEKVKGLLQYYRNSYDRVNNLVKLRNELLINYKTYIKIK